MVSQLLRGARFLGLILPLALGGCAGKPPVVETEQPAAAAESIPTAPVETPALIPDIKATAPTTYIVRKGDTLWAIAGQYLSEPWHWPDLWSINPDIANPDLIYPGDVLTLYYDGDRPQVRLSGGPRFGAGASASSTPDTGAARILDTGSSGTVKLVPRIRTEDVDLVPQPIPIQAIGPFLIRPRIVGAEVLDSAGYILASEDGRLIFGNDDQVYVRNLEGGGDGARLSVFRPGKVFRDRESGDVLGYEAVHIADGKVIRPGEPATVKLFNPTREALTGDRLMPTMEDTDYEFVPNAPRSDQMAHVISLFSGISEVGAKDVVAIDLGTKDGVERGNVFSVYAAGQRIRDSVSKEVGDSVKLPDELSGLLMVFRTFDRISYALVMESTRPVREGDVIGPPTRGAFKNEFVKR